MNALPGIVTALLLVAFLGVVAWAYSSRRKHDYEHLARVTQLIFAAAWQITNQTEKVSSLDRRRLKQIGYICPPCPFGCDTEIHDRAGVCPVCGMNLMPKFVMKTD